jgi:hypothetical protein
VLIKLLLLFRLCNKIFNTSNYLDSVSILLEEYLLRGSAEVQ